MCNCNSDMLVKIQDRVKETLPKHDEKTFKADWQNKVWRLDDNPGDVMLSVNYEYLRLKESGVEYKNKTKGSISMSMTYCPFCGVKYVD